MQVVGEPARNIRRRVPALLDVVGLSDKLKRFPDELSGESSNASLWQGRLQTIPR